MDTKKLISLLIKYRSSIASLLLFVVLYISRPTALSLSIGFFLIVSGMLFRAWSAGHINKNNELATGGPYALTRNPLYFGNFLIGLGVATAGRTLACYLIFFIYYVVFFPFLMYFEHQQLKKKFKEKYLEWYQKSNTFFPKIKRIHHSDFNISLYVRNKEYRVAFFSLLVVMVLIFKTISRYKSI